MRHSSLKTRLIQLKIMSYSTDVVATVVLGVCIAGASGLIIANEIPKRDNKCLEHKIKMCDDIVGGMYEDPRSGLFRKESYRFCLKQVKCDIEH